MHNDAGLVFEEMVSAGISLDAVSCGALLVALNKGNYPEESLRIGKSFQERGILFDEVAYTEMLSACNK